MPSPAFAPAAPLVSRRHTATTTQPRRTSTPLLCARSIHSTLLSPRSPPRAPRATPDATPAVRSRPLPDHPNWRYAGPPLSAGALPAVLYLALSATQSLELPPFNTPVAALLASPTPPRVLSVTLPFHGPDMAANDAALGRWAAVYAAGGDPVAHFVRRVSTTLDALVDAGLVRPGGVVVAGLSRGGLLAGLLAARNRHVRACVAFAPVTELSGLREFEEGGKVERAALGGDVVVGALARMPVRFYVGNFDRRVGTRGVFEVVHRLAERAGRREGVRSPPHEFIMYCSIGKEGHGTPPDVFRAGAQYALEQLELV